MRTVKEIKAEQTYKLREDVLRKNIDLPSQFSGDLDKDTIHFGLFDDLKLLSIVSLMKKDHKNLKGVQYQLRGMATKEKYQKKGYGKEIITRVLEILKERGVDIVWCNARIAALDFYKKQGFKITGDEFDIPQIGGHYVMYRVLKD